MYTGAVLRVECHVTLAQITVREELVLKVAIMAERFATEFEWYVDVILRLVQVGGAAVSNDIWCAPYTVRRTRLAWPKAYLPPLDRGSARLESRAAPRRACRRV